MIVAKVTAEPPPEPRPDLHDQRLIQPEPVAHGGELLRIDVAGLVTTEDQQGHVPGNDTHDHEHEGGRPEQRRDDQEQPLRDVRLHTARLNLRPATRPGASDWKNDWAAPRSSSPSPNAPRRASTRGPGCSTRCRGRSSRSR